MRNSSPQPSALTGFTTDEVVLFDGETEPRVRDLALGQRLGFGRDRNVRQIILRNLPELETYGEVRRVAQQTSTDGGRPTEEFWLTEQQALVICALSRTPVAASVRRLLIEAFLAFRSARQAAPVLLPPAPISQQTRNRIRYAKLRLVEAVSVLDELGVDVMAIDMATVLRFSRAVIR